MAALVCVAAAAAAGWVLAGGSGASLASDLPDWLPIGRVPPSTGVDGTARLGITSQPDRATVLLDGQQRGRTPLMLTVDRGAHLLTLMHPATVNAQRRLDVSADLDVSVSMLRRRPDAMQLKPAFPGASITGAAFLADGRLAVSMAVPGQGGTAQAGSPSEPWIFDPATGSLVPFRTTSNPRAAIVAVSPDGGRVAYAQPRPSGAQSGTTRQRLADVLVAGPDAAAPPARVFTLPAVNANLPQSSGMAAEVEELHDLTWTPDGRHMLVTLRLVGLAGGRPAATRSRLLLVDGVTGEGLQATPIELLTLPAEIVAGSYSWAPDGHWVAFLTQAASGSGGPDSIALCAVDTAGRGEISGFRYVADLGRPSSTVGPLPVAAVAWSPALDGRLVYAAPTPKVTVSNPLGLPTTSGGESGLFVAAPTGPGLTAEEGVRLGSAIGLIAPAWPSTDETTGTGLIALARSDQGNRPLVIRGVDPVSGMVRNLDVVLPAGVGGTGAVAARWDLAHGRLLVLARHDTSTPGLLDYWLVQLQAQAGGRGQ